MKKFLLTALAALASLAISANAVKADRLWIIGEPAGGWDTTLGIELDKTADGVFEYDADFDSKKSFGFVDRLAEANDWESFNAHRYVAPDWGTVPVVGENPMEYATSDYCWDLPAGKYHMTIDTNKMQLIIATDEEGGDIPEVKIPDLFFVGEVNGWQFKDEYRFTADENKKVFTYKAAVIRSSADCAFKIAADGWVPEYTTEVMDMKAGETYTMMPGKNRDNMGFAEDLVDGVLVFDSEAMTLAVYDATTGIDNVEVSDNDSTVYYNLQGVEVANPTQGIYIERRGTSVRKVIIK